jgi:pimeloyl-ACP methyl ester carboxylesterase
LLFPYEATVVLDDDWWLNSEEVAAFPAEVARHLSEHRRRPVTRSALLAPPVAEAWQTVPTTLLLSRSDSLLPVEQQDWAHTHFSDVRIVEGNHFLPLLKPDLVAAVITETFATAH